MPAPGIPKVGRGSNQYKSSAGSRVKASASRAGTEVIRNAVETERVASAFLGGSGGRVRGRTLGALILRAASNEPEDRSAVARMGSCPSEMLDVLAGDSDPLVRKAVAQNPGASDAALRWLSTDSVQRVREIVATHSRDGEWLSSCARDVTRVRVCAARNPNLSESDAVALATDGESKVRESLAAHSAHAQLLTDLIEDKASAVRRSAVENWNTPRNAAELALHDKVGSVREALARRQDLPSSVVAALRVDPLGVVRSAVNANAAYNK